MERQIYISSNKSDPLVEKKMKFEGSDVTVRLSPTDIPRSLSSKFDEKSKTLVITFDYSDDETAAIVAKEDPSVVIHEGKYSGKLLKIYVSLDKQGDQPPAATLKNRLSAAFSLRRQKFHGMKTISKELNQAVAETVLSDEKVATELLSATTAK